MKINRLFIGTLMFGVLFVINLHGQATAFSQQGQLNVGGVPANGSFDLAFRLFDLSDGGSQQGSTVERLNVVVTNGIYTVLLDFGAASLPGATRFLDISVRQSGVGAFTQLTPRQAVTSAPYAIRSLSAANADNSTNSAQLGNVAASQFLQTNGNGSNLSNLNAGSVSTGTLANARLGQNTMTNLISVVLLIMMIVTTAQPVASQSGGAFTISRSVIGGGGKVSGGAFSANLTIGQAVAGGPSRGAVFNIVSGFWGGGSAVAPQMRTVFDLDGDGKTDISIFRPGPGEWWYSRSSDGGNAALQFGESTDKVVASDFTGDGRSDISFWRPSTGLWYILRSEDLSYYAFPFGTSGDVPVPADFDGDGKADPAVFRPSTLTWFISSSSGGTDIVTFGATGDKPVVADYDGDDKADIAIFRPTLGQWWIRRSSNLVVFATTFGVASDRAVPGDYTGDGKADIAYWRPSTGFWNILRSEDLSYYAFPFGANGDVPSPGDYDGDGRFDATVFRPSNSNWYSNRSTAGVLIQQFGISGDLPLPSVFVP